MARKEVPASMIFLLVMLAVVGVAANLHVFLDVPWLRRPGTGIGPGEPGELGWEGVRESVFLVHLPRCDGDGRSSGTAFSIAPGYLVTCAHVIADNVTCGGDIKVIDSEGREQTAVLDSHAEEHDLALLKITDVSVPTLPLADSALYEQSDAVLRVYTIGYPLVGAASTPDQASFSGVGTISQYEDSSDRFITSGLNMNPGNSGGPVLFEDQRLVLGVASAKLDPSVGEGIGYVIPAKTLKDFFFEKTGQALPDHALPGNGGSTP